jgi:hypothetical protein
MKYAIALLAVLGIYQVSHADTLVDVTATQCDACVSTPTEPIQLPAVSLDLELTVTPVTGVFFDPGYDMDFTETVDEITSMSGTLNGNPVTMVGTDYLTLGNYQLGWVCFDANNQESCAWNDFENNDLSIGTSFEQITWDAVDPIPTPEPQPNVFPLMLFTFCAALFLNLETAVRYRTRLRHISMPCALLSASMVALLLWAGWMKVRS